MNAVAERILQTMKDKEVSYGDLSEETGISKSALQRYATGETEKIPLDRIEKIANSLGVTSQYILGWDVEEEDVSPILRMFGNRIHERRSELGLAIQCVAKYIKVTPQALTRYENGDARGINNEQIERLAEILKCTPSHIIGWDSIDNVSQSNNDEDWTPEELDEIEKFKEFLRSKRPVQ